MQLKIQLPAKGIVLAMSLGVAVFSACSPWEEAASDSPDLLELDGSIMDTYVNNQAEFMLNAQEYVAELSAEDRKALSGRLEALKGQAEVSLEEAGDALGFAPGAYAQFVQGQHTLVRGLVADLEAEGYTTEKISQAFVEAVGIQVPQKLDALARGNCATKLNICNQNAGNDFAISSATCATAWILGPGGWSTCQAIANFSYYADQVECMDNYDSCSSEGTPS
ncbi:MAG: hypothetical protein AAFQ98_21685 [Bacteroidota bacterium]